jgi:hypothetical protein
MSTSFVEYRGRGFWSFDGYLEHALALLSGAFKGWIHPDFDEYLTHEERRERVLSLLREVLSNTQRAREARETLDLMEALLRGHLNTDASSAPDYMVSGPQPYKWVVQSGRSNEV